MDEWADYVFTIGRKRMFLKNRTILGLQNSFDCMCAVERVKGSCKRIALMFFREHIREVLLLLPTKKTEITLVHLAYRDTRPSCFKR